MIKTINNHNEECVVLEIFGCHRNIQNGRPQHRTLVQSGPRLPGPSFAKRPLLGEALFFSRVRAYLHLTCLSPSEPPSRRPGACWDADETLHPVPFMF